MLRLHIMLYTSHAAPLMVLQFSDRLQFTSHGLEHAGRASGSSLDAELLYMSGDGHFQRRKLGAVGVQHTSACKAASVSTTVQVCDI